MGDEVSETSADVVENAASTVAPDAVTTETPHGGSHAHIDAKLDRIIGLLETTHTGPSTPVNADSTDSSEGGGDIVEPAHGETIRDKSPASLPWTHKRPFKG